MYFTFIFTNFGKNGKSIPARYMSVAFCQRMFVTKVSSMSRLCIIERPYHNLQIKNVESVKKSNIV